MIFTENGYTLTCTTCPRTGQACSIGLKLARQLGQAMTAGHAMIDADFKLSGHGHVKGGCGAHCGVVYSVCKREIGVFCGVPEDSDPDNLKQFASAFLEDGSFGSGPFPKAMVVGTNPGNPVSPSAEK